MLARRAPKPQADATDPTAQPHGKVWRTSLGWSMTLMFGMTSLMTYSMFTWLPRIVVEAGGTPAFGGVMVAVFSALGLLPSLVIPSMAVRMQNPFPLVLIGFFSFVIAFTGLLLAPMKARCCGPACSASVRQPSAGADPDQPAHAHPTGSAALSGFMQGVGYSFSCLGPFLVGWLHTVSNGWTLPFSFLFGCAT